MATRFPSTRWAVNLKERRANRREAARRTLEQAERERDDALRKLEAELAGLLGE